MPGTFHLGGYGTEIHEQTEMTLNCWGQYEHDNQPVHHMLYMGIAAASSVNDSCANRQRYWLRKAVTQLYVPGDKMFCGDEDNGEMAAWYLLSAFGLYDLAPGDGVWTLGLPLFAALDIDLPNNATLHIRAPGTAPTKTNVTSVLWNNAPVNGVNIAHSTLMKGGVLQFNLA